MYWSSYSLFYWEEVIQKSGRSSFKHKQNNKKKNQLVFLNIDITSWSILQQRLLSSCLHCGTNSLTLFEWHCLRLDGLGRRRSVRSREGGGGGEWGGGKGGGGGQEDEDDEEKEEEEEEEERHWEAFHWGMGTLGSTGEDSCMMAQFHYTTVYTILQTAYNLTST